MRERSERVTGLGLPWGAVTEVLPWAPCFGDGCLRGRREGLEGGNRRGRRDRRGRREGTGGDDGKGLGGVRGWREGFDGGVEGGDRRGWD